MSPCFSPEQTSRVGPRERRKSYLFLFGFKGLILPQAAVLRLRACLLCGGGPHGQLGEVTRLGGVVL